MRCRGLKGRLFMSRPGFEILPQTCVAVVGLGLMGGSLALALRGRCAALYGYDPDSQTLALAAEMGLADHLAAQFDSRFDEAELVLLAAPVEQILALLAGLGKAHPSPAMVMDVGSTKMDILAAMSDLPLHLDPVGGHPMAGKERLTLAEAEAGLLQGAPFALVALERTTTQGRTLAEEVARAAGATALWLDAVQHDAWAAAVSHAPYLVASALALSVAPEAGALAGSGLRSATRLAATPLTMILPVLLQNRRFVLQALKNFHLALDQLESSLESGDEQALRALLKQAIIRREGLYPRTVEANHEPT